MNAAKYEGTQQCLKCKTPLFDQYEEEGMQTVKYYPGVKHDQIANHSFFVCASCQTKNGTMSGKVTYIVDESDLI